MFTHCTHCSKELPQSDDPMVSYPVAAILVEDTIPTKRLVFCDWTCLGQYSALQEVASD